MCGRFSLTANLTTVAQRFGVRTPTAESAVWAPSYNIAPTQMVVVSAMTGRPTSRKCGGAVFGAIAGSGGKGAFVGSAVGAVAGLMVGKAVEGEQAARAYRGAGEEA